MTAAELARFRTLLQTQTPPPRPPPLSLFERMRGRLTLVERVDPPAAGVVRPRQAREAPAEPLTWEQVLAPAAPAAPPPRSPPAFGRRPGEAAGPFLVAVATPDLGDPHARAPVSLRRQPPAALEPFATPDELPPGLGAPAEARPPEVAFPTPTPGMIAGWSHKRPPSPQRRILARLEAVFLAEQQGLQARCLSVESAPAAG